MPAFHALLPVRDEEDIVAECLQHMLYWADAIYVFDTGSVDRTWEIVNDYASRDARVKPIRKDNVYFSENLLRGWLFHQARQHMREGDWFLRVDADEFHHVSPPEFVKRQLRPGETVVWHQYYNFCLLESEVGALDTMEKISQERAKPISERRRWWTPSIYSEPRLCRYRQTMKWPAAVSFPYNAGYVARNRLPIRHYPHRDPIQLERRCRLRAAMHADPQRCEGSFGHWNTKKWKDLVTPDHKTELQKWLYNEDLPVLKYSNHIAPSGKRIVQYLLHRFGLSMADCLRKGWNRNNYPDEIPSEIVRRLEIALRD